MEDCTQTRESALDLSTRPRDEVLALLEDSLEELIRRHERDCAFEQLEKKFAQRESFFSLVSHDLRSPLTVAKLCADLLTRSPETPAKLLPLTKQISVAIERANGMIRDFLDARLLENGLPLAVQPMPCNLNEVLQPVVEELNLVHRGRCRYLGQAEVKGRWDRVAVRRAVDNLVSNAIKYGTPEAAVTISLEDLGGEVKISVHNFGNPISPADQSSLFEWNRRTESALQSGEMGWGLGLVLVKGVAQAHQGKVQVESAAETGTTFSIVLAKGAPVARAVH